MATSEENPRRRTTTNGNVGSTAFETIQQNSVPPPNEPVQYKNAREYAQVLRPWLWQYHTMVTMQQFLTLCPPPFFQSCHFSTNQPGVSSPNFQQQQPSHQPARPAQGQTQVNGHAPTPHIFPGVECRVPSFWKRVSAELIDFTILFYIKLIVTVVFMRELGFMDGILDYDFLENLEDIDYDRAFAITSEVIAMEIVNRLLITFFETMCLRRGIGTVGGSTPGKRLMGLRVVSCTDLQDLGHDRILVAPATDIGWFRLKVWSVEDLGISPRYPGSSDTSDSTHSSALAFIRSAIKNFTIAFFFPACLTVLMFKHNRAAYDILSNTVVVETEDV